MNRKPRITRRDARFSARDAVPSTVAPSVPRARIDPLKAIRVTLLPHAPLKGWVHSEGLAAFGHPEIEVRNVPLFLFEAAGELINDIADMLLNGTASGKPLLCGHVVQVSPLCIYRVVASEPFVGPSEDVEFANEILRAHPHWRIDDAPMEGMCEGCDGAHGHGLPVRKVPSTPTTH